VEVEPAEPAPLKASPEDLPVAVLYEDEDVIAVNKAAGMVVHAGAGRHSGTLVNALLHKFGALSGVAGELRPGIVHRLDRETSGVLLVAKTDFGAPAPIGTVCLAQGGEDVPGDGPWSSEGGHWEDRQADYARPGMADER